MREKQFKGQYDLAINEKGIAVARMIYYARTHKMFHIFMADIESNQYQIARYNKLSLPNV